MKDDEDAIASAGSPSCGSCGNSVDIHDPEKVVCSTHLDFRALAAGDNCAHYVRKRQHPPPPQLTTAVEVATKA